MASNPVAFAPASRRAVAAVQVWTRRRVLQPLDAFVKTINGQAAHEEVKAFMLENEAVHTALVTRVLRVESRIRLLTALGAVLAVAEVLRWIVR
jgi:hypothetical protein